MEARSEEVRPRAEVMKKKIDVDYVSTSCFGQPPEFGVLFREPSSLLHNPYDRSTCLAPSRPSPQTVPLYITSNLTKSDHRIAL